MTGAISPNFHTKRKSGTVKVAYVGSFQVRALCLLILFLVLWSVAVELLYYLFPSPHVDTTERARIFLVKLTIRTVAFFIVFFYIRLTQFVLSPAKSKKIEQWRSSPDTVLRSILRFVIYGLVGIFFFVWLQTNFMSVKVAIPEIIPFYLDEAAYKLDRIFFFGNDPYEVLGYLYTFPKLIGAIDQLYTLWAPIICGVWIYCFVSRKMDPRRRYQYIFASVALWFIAGNIMAFALSSAGPIYYGDVTGNTETYALLIQNLTAISEVKQLNAFFYKDVLWEFYQTPGSRIGGISAMPSLHVGTSLLLLVFFWNSIVIRSLLIAFNVAIFLGSILLGWHYAVDGLVVVPAVFLSWWIGGKIVRWIDHSARYNFNLFKRKS